MTDLKIFDGFDDIDLDLKEDEFVTDIQDEARTQLLLFSPGDPKALEEGKAVIDRRLNQKLKADRHLKMEIEAQRDAMKGMLEIEFEELRQTA
ncbi:MAG: hypothetical protein JWM56_12 [Candidatus Peribacteria bacterium]|nr:hypothetical protein [Candidatus Peribacteria bacterium]